MTTTIAAPATTAHTLLIIDHTDGTSYDELYPTMQAAATSLDEFLASEDLMAAEAKDGGYILIDERGRQTHTAYIVI